MADCGGRLINKPVSHGEFIYLSSFLNGRNDHSKENLAPILHLTGGQIAILFNITHHYP